MFIYYPPPPDTSKDLKIKPVILWHFLLLYFINACIKQVKSPDQDDTCRLQSEAELFPGFQHMCGSGPCSCAAVGGQNDHILESSSWHTQPGIAAPPTRARLPKPENIQEIYKNAPQNTQILMHKRFKKKGCGLVLISFTHVDLSQHQDGDKLNWMQTVDVDGEVQEAMSGRQHLLVFILRKFALSH